MKNDIDYEVPRVFSIDHVDNGQLIKVQSKKTKIKYKVNTKFWKMNKDDFDLIS